MSACDAFLDLLQEDLDGRLDGAGRASLEMHVASCASCARERERLRRVRAGLRAMPPVTAPAGFRDDVIARLPQRGRLLRLPWFALGAVAAAALVVVAVQLSWQGGPGAETARVSASDAAGPPAGLVGTASRVAHKSAEEERNGGRKKTLAEEAAAQDDADAAKPAGTKEEAKLAGPVGEIPPATREPKDPSPPETSGGPATPGETAGGPATPGDAPETERQRAPEVADREAAPRVRLAVFRTRAAADAFVATLSARDDGALPPAAGKAPATARAAAAPPEPAAEKDGGFRSAGAYAEVARVGLPDAASLARAQRAIASSGGRLSEPVEVSLAGDALVSEELARAVAERLESAAAAASTAGGGAAGAPRDAKEDGATGRGGTPIGGEGGDRVPSGFGARTPAPTPRPQPPTAPGEAAKGEGAMKRLPEEPPKDKAGAAPSADATAPVRREARPPRGEILVVVVVPERAPAPTPTETPPR